MLISVIIPVFNAQKFVFDSVTSIIKQTHRNLEIIICDDASTDGSFDILNSILDPRIKVLRNENNLGYLKTINKLFEIASGKLIAFQDADDISHPKRIEIQLQRIFDYALDLVGTNYVVIDDKGKPISPIINPMTDADEINKLLINQNLFQKPSILFKRQILDKVGGFREAFLKLKNISEDYDWLLRVNEAGFKMGNVCYDEPLYSYRSVSNAMTKGFVHVEQMFGQQIAQYLARERRAGNTDSIERGDFLGLDTYIENLKKPFNNDQSLFFIKKAEHLMYSGLNKQAISFAYKAVLASPLSLKNWRTLQYCLRKTFLGI